MPPIAASSSKWRAFSMRAVFALGLVAVIWLAVVLCWSLSSPDAWAYPAVLLALSSWIGLILWRNVRIRATQAAMPASLDCSVPAPPIPPARLPVLAGYAVAGDASGSDEFLDVLHERRMRPAPDDTLADEDGFPILSARGVHLDIEGIRLSLSRASVGGTLDVPDTEEWRDALIRPLALLDLLLNQAMIDCPFLTQAMSPTLPANDEAAAILRGGGPSVPAAPPDRFQLHVKLLFSARLQPWEQDFARTYLFDRLDCRPSPVRPIKLELVPATDDASALALADQFCRESMQSAEAQVLLLLACDSMLCQSVVDAWQAESRLFGPRRPNGLMAGEAAFGVLMANDAALRMMEVEPAAHLTRVIRKRREISADEPGRPSCACLAQIVGETLEAAGMSADTIGTVACDTDHRTSRVLESIEAMAQHTPQLDAIQNRLSPGESFGHLGAASTLGILATAVLHAERAAEPVLLFNTSHATDRAAAVLLPASQD